MMCFSVFYVFYEQYLTVVEQSFSNIGLSMLAIFVMTFVLLGFDLWTAVIVIIVIAFILASMLGFMYLWDITLNAISLVNLVMVSEHISFAAGKLNAHSGVAIAE